MWAVNAGGEAYVGKDGTAYAADAATIGGATGTIAGIRGSQDPTLYETYRTGEIVVAYPLPAGAYDLTLHFAEPERLGRGERVFDVVVEGERVVTDVDVVLWRDGQVRSALTVTVPNVSVTDGRLDIGFEAGSMEPVLSALVVRKRTVPDPGWRIAWQEDFDDEALDTATWNYETWPPRYVNDEDQAYTPRRKNVRLEDGMLVIEAHREDFAGAAYTSGRVQTRGKADFLYGRFEVRAKLPRGQGTWPAIWMLPSDPFAYATTCDDDPDWHSSKGCDAWPNSGEIDIMEHVGYQQDHVHGTVHTKAYFWVEWEQRKGRILVDSVADRFHVYALEWSADRIDIFVDGTLYFTYVNEGRGWQEWPFDRPFHLILNIAVGGAWGRAGGPVDDSIFPQRMLVDWIRVYEREP